jgi:hypothetical protein
MPRFARLFLLALLPVSAFCAASKPDGPEKMSVAQLEQSLAAANGQTDAQVAQQLSGLELTERLSAAKLAQLSSTMPGEKSRQELLILADQAAFLAPPGGELVADPMPDAAATRQMLVKIVNYVNTTARQLPNLIAVRDTSGFEDRPAQDIQQQTAVVGLSYLPLHLVGKSSFAVTYRDRKEVADEAATKAQKHGQQIGGLVTSGEFGPVMSTAVADALKGKITWARWERGADGAVAVFHYAVPNEKSNYHVRFCCVPNGYNSDGSPDLQVFDERSGYHGEIAFNPADGSILRITLEADMQAGELVPRAGILVEYGPVEIGGKRYICPQKSVSLLKAHTDVKKGMYSKAMFQGMPKTYLNDVAFGQYRRFGSETRILAGDYAAPPAGPGKPLHD